MIAISIAVVILVGAVIVLGAIFLFGDDGDDVLFGGDGLDKLHGQRGNDTLHGGNHDDSLFGGAGDDLLHGDDGHDHLAGEQGEVAPAPLAVVGDGDVAAAEEAAMGAERDVDVERELPVRRRAALQEPDVVGVAEAVREVRRRRVRRVPGAGPVVLEQHLAVELDRLPEIVHGTERRG